MRHAAFLLLILAGCEQIDPSTRAGAWRPLGANEANLRTHVVDPAMLERGRSDPADGQTVAAAVRRYRTDRVRPLPASGVAEIQPTGAGGVAAAGAGGSSGGGGDGGR